MQRQRYCKNRPCFYYLYAKCGIELFLHSDNEQVTCVKYMRYFIATLVNVFAFSYGNLLLM
jgi:hypothetical protein